MLFKWRRDYRAGKFGAADLTMAMPIRTDLAVTASGGEAAVTLLPVRAPTVGDGAVTAAPCIEVVFACATVRICGVPEVSSLRLVLDCLVRRS